MDLGLQDKVAIVTGGSEGIGKATAIGLAREGAGVVIVARRPDVLEQAAHDIRTATGGVVLPVQGDVTEKETPGRVVKAVLENFGRLDILVNNAGTAMAKSFEEVSEEDWAADFNLKVWGAVRFIHAVIPEMRKLGDGRIINVTTPGGKAPERASMPTSIARAAGIAITKGLSRDLAKDKILVSTVCIGYIKAAQMEWPYNRIKETNPGLTLEEYYDWLAKERAIPLDRRRHNLSGLGAGQLPYRYRGQHRRRGLGGSLEAGARVRPRTGSTPRLR